MSGSRAHAIWPTRPSGTPSVVRAKARWSQEPWFGAGSHRANAVVGGGGGGVTREMKIGRILGDQDHRFRRGPLPGRSLVGFQSFRRSDFRMIEASVAGFQSGPIIGVDTEQRKAGVGGHIRREA